MEYINKIFLMMAYFLDILLCAARFTSKSKIPFQASKNDVKENGIGDESMEVDGVKKSPSAPKVPSLKKQASFQSALSVLQQMVNEYDDQGFTPLLLACEMYMNYTKPPKRNNVSLYHLHKCCKNFESLPEGLFHAWLGHGQNYCFEVEKKTWETVVQG